MLIKKSLYFQLAAILLITGCVNQPVQSESPKNQTSAKPSTVELTYLNSNVFDQGVASNMNESSRTIHVKFPVRFTLNSIPERIDKWLTEIVDSDGSVEVEAIDKSDSKYRSLSTLTSFVSFAMSIYTQATRGNMYEASEKYNGRIIYESETGEIHEILLYPRVQDK